MVPLPVQLLTIPLQYHLPITVTVLLLIIHITVTVPLVTTPLPCLTVYGWRSSLVPRRSKWKERDVEILPPDCPFPQLMQTWLIVNMVDPNFHSDTFKTHFHPHIQQVVGQFVRYHYIFRVKSSESPVKKDNIGLQVQLLHLIGGKSQERTLM